MTGPELSASARVAGELLTERLRQVEGEGWSTSDDDELEGGLLAGAAANYAINAGEQLNLPNSGNTAQPPLASLWPNLCDSWTWKPKTPRRDLVRAGALIIAEIERFDRAALPHNDLRG